MLNRCAESRTVFRSQQKLDHDELLWPFLQIIVAADDEDFEAWATRQFATDRNKHPKGVVEVER